MVTDFKKYTLQDFEDAFQKEVKGGNFRDLLTWHTDEGIDVAPFYFETETGMNLSTKGNEWEINTEIVFTDLADGNKRALAKLNEGATSLTFDGKIDSVADLTILMKEIGIQFIEVNFRNTDAWIVSFYAQYCKEKNIDPKELKGCFHLSDCTEKDVSVFPNMQLFTVNGSKFHNAGGNITQQLSFLISEAKELLEKLIDQGFSPENAIKNIRFSISIGPDFFFEIAKIRALRVLWRNVTGQYAKGEFSLHIHGETSKIWLANEDENNNLIRAAFQTLSATSGGCNSFYVHPFSNQNSDAGRLGIGVQLVVREEGFLNKVGDVGAGSFYIEEVTAQLVKNAWKKFQEVEKTGGFSATLKSGKMTDDLHESAVRLKQNITSGKIKVIGVNKQRTDKTEKAFNKEIQNTGKIEIINLFD